VPLADHLWQRGGRTASTFLVPASRLGADGGTAHRREGGNAHKAGHIPGAVSLPVDETWDGRLPKDKTALVVFYCGGEQCSLSGVAAQRALELGYKKVAVYKGGWHGWAQTASR
jgi:rhodanese-related sulfurtransferase